MSAVVQVRFFAVLADEIGSRQDTLTLHEAPTVSKAIARLASRHAAVERMRDVLAVAVNDQFASMDASLHDDDVVTLIPPVSGG